MDALARTIAGLVGAPGSGIERPLVGAEEEHRGVLVKDVLRAVAVVHVPIHDQHASHAVPLLRVARRDGDVVEQAETHPASGVRVMPGRADGAEGVARLAREHGIHRVQHSAHRAHRDIPGLGRDVGVAGTQVRPPGLDVAPRRLEVLHGVAKQQLVLGSGAHRGTPHPPEQSGARKSAHDGIIPFRPLRMRPSGEVPPAPLVRHQKPGDRRNVFQFF